MAEDIDRDAPLHALSLTFDAPVVLTSGALTTPIEDFAVLYRMSTGIYGQYGLRRFNEPFAYARPYARTLHFGSPYFFEIVLPTVVIVGGIKGLPSLILLVKQIIVEPGRTRRELKENKAGRLKAEEEIIDREQRIEDPDQLRELASATRDAEIAEAHLRKLKSRAEMERTLSNLDPEMREAVLASYGDDGMNALVDIARRAQGGPTVPRELNVSPVENPEEFPTPPERRELQPPSK